MHKDTSIKQNNSIKLVHDFLIEVKSILSFFGDIRTVYVKSSEMNA